MNWDKATQGLYAGLLKNVSLRIDDARIAWDFIHTIQDFRDRGYDPFEDSTLCAQTINELVPDFDNEWDYEWPDDLKLADDSDQSQQQ